MYFTFAHINVNCLTNKLHYVYSFLVDNHITVLGLSETWLTSLITDASLNIPNYTLLRKDVTGNVPKHGVSVYVRNDLTISEITTDIPNVLVIFLPHILLYVITIYRPPSYTSTENNNLLDFLSEFCLGKDVLLMGDFNLPSIKWNNDLQGDGLSPTDLLFYNCFTSLGLTEWVLEPTFLRSGNILDLILTSEPDRIIGTEVLPPFPNCGHSPVKCNYILSTSSSNDTGQAHRLWSKGNYTEINLSLSTLDWDLEFMYLNIDDMYKRFLDIINSLVDVYIPLSTRNKHSFWPVKPPATLKRRRQSKWKSYKDSRAKFGRRSDAATLAFQEFMDVNYQCRTYTIQRQINYEQSLVDSLVSNPKVFHAYIRNKKVGRVGVGPLTSPEGRVVTDPLEMSEIFAAAFSSVYSQGTPANQFSHQFFDGTILYDVIIGRQAVINAISKLNSNSAMGPDELHPFLLKSCVDYLSYPLMLIFQKSYQTGKCPLSWKKSYVVPIFKKGSRSDPLKYRPISLTSVCCKSLESILVKVIYDYLCSNDLLNDEQFGFRSGRSTEEQLLLTYNDITLSLDNGNLVDLILFDYSKAFDVVNHTIMIDKLQNLGISGKILHWIKDFLHDRTMNVVVSHTKSSPKTVFSGVPQGSVLGPLLFLIYINFINSNIRASTKIFADDLKLYVSSESTTTEDITRMIDSFQNDINILFQTSASWGLALNPSKCVALRFVRGTPQWPRVHSAYHINNDPIPFQASAVDL